MEETKIDAKVCPNCGKPLEEGKVFKKDDTHFCCENCCQVGERKEKKMTCEFC